MEERMEEELIFTECPICDGDGWRDEYNGIPCPRCDGTGEVELIAPLHSPGLTTL